MFQQMLACVLTFLFGFAAMEVVAWAAHRFLMHGFLWRMHRDHHTPGDGFFQRNDGFFVVFALPSYLSIQIGVDHGWPALTAFGFGVMAYGAAYVTVHEILIHRRFKFLQPPGAKGYLHTIVRRHREHHQRREKENGVYFGMLWAPPREWKR